MEKKRSGFNGKQMAIWIAAMVVGGILGHLNVGWINELCNFIAAAYTRLFQFVAVPTIALALATTLISLGAKKNTGRIFLYTVSYTLLTSFVAVVVGYLVYRFIAPENLAATVVEEGLAQVPQNLETLSYYDHILSVIPNNVMAPYLSGNVLSLLLISAAAGMALAFMPATEPRNAVINVIFGLQELLFTLIRALVWTLPLGIIAFSAQLSAQIGAGVAMGSIGKYVVVILAGNLIQFFVILPIFMLIKGVNPLHVFRCMLPAVLMALFTKSSAATLPVTVASAENNLKAKPEVAHFILPICCTINMNGCAAFIFVTSFFVMQNAGIAPVGAGLLMWMVVAVCSAIGNAGVPMGCYFLTLSLMSNVPGVLGIMGVILPVYALIDMIETAENVWSDCCICAVVDKKMRQLDAAAEGK